MSRQERWLAEGQVTSEPAMVHGELDGRGPAPPALIDEELADQLRFRPFRERLGGAVAGGPGAGPPAIPRRQVVLMERSKSPKPARAGKCGRARSGALPCAGVPAVTVNGRCQPEAQPAGQRRVASPAAGRWLICALSAGHVRWSARSLARRAFASGVAGHTAPLLCAG